MRILDRGHDRPLSKIGLFLTKDEALELRDSLTSLLENKARKGFHHHINNAEYSKEITLAIYSENDLSEFDKRTQHLIQDDE